MSVRVVVIPRSLGIPRRYWISAAAHVLLLVAWAWAPSRTTSFKPIGDSMTVGLVAAPPSGGGARTVAPAAPPVPAPVEPPEPKGPSVQPEPKPEPKKPKDKKTDRKNKEEKAPNTAEVPSTAQGSNASPSGPAAPGTGMGGSGAPGTTVSLGGGQPGTDFYSASVRAAIEPRWRKPVLDSDAPSEVTLSFQILRDGTVRDVQVQRTSGIAALDRSAMRAVIEASPLPPFPAGWRGTSTAATMTFILLPE